MSSEHRKFIAAQVLSEQRAISYRTVSRALKVHVNAAKCMLHDFHAHENEKKPGSIHATYLLAGVKKPDAPPARMNGHTNGQKLDAKDDTDEPMPSSPPPFTSSGLESSQDEGNVDEEVDRERVPVRTITLVREEALEVVKEQYETITSIHVYGLSPHRLQDLQTLIATARSVYNSTLIKEDPLVHNKTYGVIQNAGVRRRSAKRPPQPSEISPSNFKPVKEELKTASNALSTTASFNTKPFAPSNIKKESAASRPSTSDSATTAKPQPTLNRNTSDIFKSFAKAKSKPPILAHKDSDTSRDTDSAPQSAHEDQKMFDEDESEEEGEAMFLDTNTKRPAVKKRPSNGSVDSGVGGRDERAAKLRKMMEDDEHNTDITGPSIYKTAVDASASKQPGNASSTKVDDAIALPPENVEEENVAGSNVAWSDSETETRAKAKDAPPQVPASIGVAREVSSGETSGLKRRRGRRRVMKKRTVKDEEGYLVTREEAVWESFSDDEPGVKPKPKTDPSSSATRSGGAASQKRGGNIMSFFGKK